MSGRVLCVDYGTARIGLAVSEGKVALPLDVIPGSDAAVDDIAARARELEVTDIVVGLPLRTNGTSGPEASGAREFARLLEDVTGLAVHLWDERFSSVEAERVMRARGADARRQRGSVDKVAAAIVLQSYLDAHAGS
jgi:putative Holliday junction resolvase